MRYAWIVTFLLAALLWSVHIDRPVDLPSWHEFDYSSIARNFLREGNNILYPRIDWRGDGPGYTEMEFPAIPWLMAQSYRLTGIQEITGRLLSYASMLLSLFVFARIAVKFLPSWTALLAVWFFMVNHEIVQVATAIQPESLMLLLYLMSVYFFVEWYDRQGWLRYSLAILSFAGAMLIKSPAAHLAIFFLLWALYKEGLKAFRRPSLYCFAVLSFAPALWWYAHAAGLWRQFHNSMGVSNEDHWLGMDLLKRPKVVLNLIGIDFLFVLGVGGFFVIASALKKEILRLPVSQFAWRWSFSVALYLIVIIRTAGGYWAAYYHVVAVPAMALLFAAGVSQLSDSVKRFTRTMLWCCGVSVAVLSAFLLTGEKRETARLPGLFQDLLLAHTSLGVLVVLGLASLVITVLMVKLGGNGIAPVIQALPRLSAGFVAAGCLLYFFVSGQLLLGSWVTFASRTPQFECAAAFRNAIPSSSLIVASGGICQDAGGHRVANDAPNMFYWLDRKGFSTCQGEESVAEMKALARRGADYLVEDRTSAASQSGLEAQLRSSFPVLGECETAWLFDLRQAK